MSNLNSNPPANHRLSQLAKEWMIASREILLNLSEPLGAVIRGTLDEPTAVLVVHPSTKVFIHEIDGKTTSSIGKIPADHLLLLSTQGVAKKELEGLLQTINQGTQANIEGATACLALGLKLKKLAETNDHQGQIDAISDASDAAIRNGSIIGRCLHKSIADGHAHYMVTGVIGDKVRLNHLDAIDGYSIPEWGHKSWVDKEDIEMHLNIQHARKKMFGMNR